MHDHSHDHEHLHDHDHAHDHEHTHAHSHSHTHTATVVNRLARTIGHLEFVKRMVEDGRDCSEVLIQIAAVRGSLASISRVILKDHMEHCIVDAIESGDTETIEQLNKAIDQLLN